MYLWKSPLEKVLASWRSRSLSYSGLVLVVNTLALSRIWYVASLVPLPRWALQEINSLVFSFLWGGRRDLVVRNVVVHHCADGGLNMVSPLLTTFALLVQWIHHFRVARGGWVSLMTFWFFDHFGFDPFFAFSFPSLFYPSLLSPFYADVLLAWRAVGVALLTMFLLSGLPCLVAHLQFLLFP